MERKLATLLAFSQSTLLEVVQGEEAGWLST